MWYHPGGLRDKISSNLFVKGLPASTKSKDLNAFFNKFGNIVSCKAVYGINGVCKGYGYLQYETKEGAEKAIAQANGKEFNGSKIEVMHFHPRSARGVEVGKYNNLYVKCFPKSYTVEDLKKLFTPFGEIISVFVKEGKGFGFVCFKTAEEAKTAETKLNNSKLEGQSLYVCRALRKEDRKRQLKEERMLLYKDCNLYVRDFPEDTNDEKLKSAFSQFGEVVSARVMLEKRQNMGTDEVECQSKGYGFVCFKTPAEAAKAKEASQTTEIMGRKLYVNIAESKEERSLKYMNRFQFMPYLHFGPQMGPPPRGFYPPPHPGMGRFPPYRRGRIVVLKLMILKIRDIEDLGIIL